MSNCTQQSAGCQNPERKTHQSWPPILHETKLTVDNTITETKKQIDKGTDRQT